MPRPEASTSPIEGTTAEEVAARGTSFDAVLLLEVVEHVPDVPAFLKGVAPLVKPGRRHDPLHAQPHAANPSRSPSSAPRYILRWLPVGTHQWQRFVTPAELASALSAAGLAIVGTEGLIYDPFSDEWRLGTDTDVNFFATATRR